MANRNVNMYEVLKSRFNDERISKYIELLMFGRNASERSDLSRDGIRRIAIVLTTKCNLECVWCHREEDELKTCGYLEKEANFGRIKSLLPSLEGFSMLHWGGLGEPLLYKKIYELSTIARRYVPNVKVTTNGTTLSKSVVEKISTSGITHIEVSIDGFDDVTNKKFRGSEEEKIIENLEHLSEISNIPIQINTVIAKQNVKSIYDAVDRLRNIKTIKSIHTIPLFMTKHMLEAGINPVLDSDHIDLLMHLKKKVEDYGLNWEFYPDVDKVDIDPVIVMKKEKNICFTPYEDPMINVDGNLVPCGRLQHYNMGNVFEDGFDAVWNGRKMLAWRKDQLLGNYNRDCQRECSMKNTCLKT